MFCFVFVLVENTVVGNRVFGSKGVSLDIAGVSLSTIITNSLCSLINWGSNKPLDQSEQRGSKVVKANRGNRIFDNTFYDACLYNALTHFEHI